MAEKRNMTCLTGSIVIIMKTKAMRFLLNGLSAMNQTTTESNLRPTARVQDSCSPIRSAPTTGALSTLSTSSTSENKLWTL